MLEKRTTVFVCPFCDMHHRDKKESKLHERNCDSNPALNTCLTCQNWEEGQCLLELVPVDFKKKKKLGRHCPSWKMKVEE